MCISKNLLEVDEVISRKWAIWILEGWYTATLWFFISNDDISFTGPSEPKTCRAHGPLRFGSKKKQLIEGNPILTPSWSVLDFWKIKFEKSGLTNWNFNVQKSILKLIFVGYTGSKNPVWTGKKFQLVLKSIFISVWNKCPNGYFKKPVQINRG